MSSLAIHFSSARDDWSTPWDFFKAQETQFGPFDLDVCATPENAKCPRFFTREQNGLEQPWTGRCWMNPPYGREIGLWVKKAAEEVRENAECVVCLLPARTDTAWWHDYVARFAVRVVFVRGRITFAGAQNSAPFPSAVVVFKNMAVMADKEVCFGWRSFVA